MPSSYTTSLRIEKMLTGEKTSTWGTIANTNFGDLMETAVAGVVAVTHDDTANYSLTAVNGAADEARNAVLEVSGTLTANRNVVCPTVEKIYTVKNGTTGGFDFTIKTSGGTGILIPNGKTRLVYCDGTNVVDQFNDVPSNVTVGGSTIHTSGSTDTLTNKTIALGGNTVSGTTAQFNTALTDGSFTTLAGTETLTNKTINLTSNTLVGTTAQFNTALSDGSFATLAGSETLTNKTLTSPVISTISNTGTLTLPTASTTLVGTGTTNTLTNKTINSASNTVTVNLSTATVTGTTAQFNTALSDGSFATLAGSQTLTNKTISLTSNTLTATTVEFNAGISDDDFVTLTSDQTLIGKTLTAPTLTAPAITGISQVPTESPGNNSTRIASTAYALAAAVKVSLVTDTAIATTSGTSKSWTSIPSGKNEIALNLADVSTNGSSNLFVRIGPIGGLATTGYVSFAHDGQSNATNTTGFLITTINGDYAWTGSVVLRRMSAGSHKWVLSGNLLKSLAVNRNDTISGYVTLSGEITQLQILAVNGTDAFDAGEANISYQ